MRVAVVHVHLPLKRRLDQRRPRPCEVRSRASTEHFQTGFRAETLEQLGRADCAPIASERRQPVYAFTCGHEPKPADVAYIGKTSSSMKRKPKSDRDTKSKRKTKKPKAISIIRKSKPKPAKKKRAERITLPGMQGPVDLSKPIHLPGMGKAKLTKRQALKRFV